MAPRLLRQFWRSSYHYAVPQLSMLTPSTHCMVSLSSLQHGLHAGSLLLGWSMVTIAVVGRRMAMAFAFGATSASKSGNKAATEHHLQRQRQLVIMFFVCAVRERQGQPLSACPTSATGQKTGYFTLPDYLILLM